VVAESALADPIALQVASYETMSTPAEQHPIDPISHSLGRLEGRLDGVDKRLATLERYVVWGFGITWTLVIATGILTRLVHG